VTGRTHDIEPYVEVIRAVRRRVAPLVLSFLIFVVASLYLVVVQPRRSSDAAGIAGLAVFGPFLLTSILMLVRPPIVVLFGDAGIAVPTSIRHRRRAPVVP
jgi:hypothetical protein